MSENDSQNDQEQGGRGDNIDLSRRSDRRMVARAIKRRWKVPEEMKELLLSRAMQVLQTTDDDRAIVGIGRLVVQMEGQNQADEHLEERYQQEQGRQAETIRDVMMEAPEVLAAMKRCTMPGAPEPKDGE